MNVPRSTHWLAATGFVFVAVALTCCFAGNGKRTALSANSIRFLGYEERPGGRYALFQITNTWDRAVECVVPSGSAVWTGTNWQFQSPGYSWNGPNFQRKRLQAGETFEFFVPFPPSNARWRPWVFYRPRGSSLLEVEQEVRRRLHFRIETRLDGPVFSP